MSDAGPRFYRLLRNTVYHTAGTILMLEPHQAQPGTHELVALPAAATGGAEDAGAVAAALAARVEALERDLVVIGGRVSSLEAARNEPAPQPLAEPSVTN